MDILHKRRYDETENELEICDSFSNLEEGEIPSKKKKNRRTKGIKI